MSHYSYNIDSTFTSNGVDHARLYRKIKSALNIKPTLTLTADTVEIDFQTTLTSGQETILNNTIAAHDPLTQDLGNNIQIFPTKSGPFSSTTYQSIGVFTYPGYNIDTLTNIKIISYINVQSNYYVRVYDITNNKQIAEKTLNNTSEMETDLGTLTNVPLGNALFDIQIKVENNPTRVYPRSIILYYN